MNSSKKIGEIFAERLLNRDIEGKASEKIIKDFATYIVLKNKTSQLPKILNAFVQKWNVLKDEIDVKFETAEDTVSSLPKKLFGKTVNPKHIVNKNLIAGMKISVLDYEIDASLSGSLKRIKQFISR